MGDPPDDPSYHHPPIENPNLAGDALLSHLESLEISRSDLQSRSMAAEETLADFPIRSVDLTEALDEASQERGPLRIELLEGEVSATEHEELDSKESSELAREIELSRARASELLDERRRRDGAVSEILDSVRSAKECLRRTCERIEEVKPESVTEEEPDEDDELGVLMLESKSVYKLGMAVESKIAAYEAMRRKERKEWENSIVSLTEENRDMGSLLRVALAEKEAVEKSLSRLKGSGEQKRVAILQIAERGLQKVGFGFMIGATAGESPADQSSSSNATTRSDGSECEEDTSLASTIEKIMKNLRLEITDLKRSLEESRSDSERLQALVDKQAQNFTESTLYIKDLEEREIMLAQNVEELMMEVREAGEEVARWREACELEVEAGKAAIDECGREVGMLKEELELTTAALDASNSKLKLKERLAATAMAAQAAAEASLRLADIRSVGLRERIEELTRQVEEEADRGRTERSGSGRKRARHMCWPWRALRLAPAAAAAAAAASASRGGNRRRTLPEMEALLHLRV